MIIPTPYLLQPKGQTLIKVHLFEFRRAVDIDAQTSSPGADNACDGQSHDTEWG
jgi:hypothetical protein